MNKGVFKPNTIKFALKVIFKVLCDNGIDDASSDFENKPGSYWKLWAPICSFTRQKRNNFGTTANRAPLVFRNEYNLCHTANPPFRPYENYLDLLDLFVWKLGRDLKLKSKEVSASVK